MNNTDIFNSVQSPVPPIRHDIDIIPVSEDGRSYLYFHDSRGYSTPNLALQQEAEDFLSLIDGRKSINDIKPYVSNSISKEQLLEFVQFLDENRLLASRFFKKYARQTEQDYEQSTVHESVTAGNSYPAEPEALKQLLDEEFSRHNLEKEVQAASPKALYAPHIDPRVGMESYVKAFSSIRNLTPDRVVVIATSHYAGLHPETYQEDPFILVNKDIKMPLDTVKRDREAIADLLEKGDRAGITANDRAHRREHSIELHLLFLSYLWQHDFQVIPFLVRDISDLYYMKEGHLGQQMDHFSELLRDRFGEDENTFFLISGDLAHFGKKFGDPQPASSKFSEVEAFDQRFLENASRNSRDGLLELMKEDMDPYRICGFPPLYSFLQSMPHLEGEVLSYNLWDETERESAVTFGSILYS